MLTAIREHSKGWLSGIVIGAIILTFALFGISSYLEGVNQTPIATVDGEAILTDTYRNQLTRQHQVLAAQLGANFDPALLESAALRRQILNGLIDNRVLDQYLAAQHYQLPAAQLRHRIENTATFQTEGRFDAALYRDILARNRLSAQQYEASEQQNAIAEQFRTALLDSAFVLETELEQLLTLFTQTRSADYALLRAERFVPEITIDAAATKAEYQNNINDYQAEARVKVDYLELSVSDLAAGLTVSEAELAATWELAKQRYKTAEVRKASHILFEVGDDASTAQKQTIRAAAEAVLAEAQGGADFAELARAHSDDASSSAQGGDLGVITPGQMVESFEHAVLDMQPDEIRGLVESRFGYHIIKLTELVAEHQQTLQEVRAEVVAEAQRQQAEILFTELGNAFQDLVFQYEDSLDAAADELGIPIKTSDWFTPTATTGIAADAAVRRAAFSEEVLQEERNSPVIEIGFDKMLALRKHTYEAAQPKPFEQVETLIIDKLKLAQSKQQVAELGQQLLEQLQPAAAWDTIAQHGLRSQALPSTRQEIAPELHELGDAVYAQRLTDTGGATYGGVSLSNGDYALFTLKTIQLGDAPSADEATKQHLRQLLQARDSSQVYQQFTTALRAAADVQIDEQQLSSN